MPVHEQAKVWYSVLMCVYGAMCWIGCIIPHAQRSQNGLRIHLGTDQNKELNNEICDIHITVNT